MDTSLSPITFALLMISVGIVLLAVPQLLLNHRHRQVVLPLVCFLLAGATANSLPALIEIFPAIELYAVAVVLPCYLLLPISLTLYVEAVTSATPWRLQTGHLRRLWPFFLGLAGSLLLVTLPKATLQAIFRVEDPELSLWPQLVIFGVFLLMVLWVGLSAYHIVRILRRLMRYRASLKQLFANNEHRELYWLSSLVGVLALTWAVSLLYSVPLLTNQRLLLPVELIAAFYTLLMWVLALFGSRQRPGFEGRYLPDSPEVTSAAPVSVVEKYQKSGLDEAQMSRIATKIEQGMKEQKLYLDSTLSLQSLASELGISPNYVSQTLNEFMAQTFFDYVNNQRIQHAIPDVIKAEKSILDIAMDAGFNARSSFYKAFKGLTGMSPTEYRKHLSDKRVPSV